MADMPRGSSYQGPPESLSSYLAVVDASGNGAAKGAKSPYTSRNGHMFSFLDADGAMALRMSPEMEAEFRIVYNSGDVIQYNRKMDGYSSVPEKLLHDPEILVEWYDRSWDWIGTLKP